MPVRRAIENFIERARNLRQARKPLLRHIDRNQRREIRLQFQRRNDRREIGIAAPLAQSVQRSLHLPHARAHRRERIRHRLPRIIMCVNAEMRSRNVQRNLPHNPLDLVRQRAAIRVTQHNPPRTRLIRRDSNRQCIFRIGLVPVKEMLAIEHHLASAPMHRRDTVRNRVEIFLERAPQRHMHLIIPRLADKTNRIACRIKQRGNARIIRGRTPHLFRHAERRKPRRLGPLLRKKRSIERVRTRVTALDIINPQPVEQTGNLHLVLERKINTRRLRPVAQRGIKQKEAIGL